MITHLPALLGAAPTLVGVAPGRLFTSLVPQVAGDLGSFGALPLLAMLLSDDARPADADGLGCRACGRVFRGTRVRSALEAITRAAPIGLGLQLAAGRR